MSPAADQPVVLAPGVSIAPEAIRFSFVRSSGPGGQAVNKLATKAQLRVAVTSIQGLGAEALDRLRAMAGRRLTREDELVISSGISRHQSQNREACLERLRDLVVQARTVPKKRKKSRPTRASVERRLDSKRRDADTKARRRSSDDG